VKAGDCMECRWCSGDVVGAGVGVTEVGIHRFPVGVEWRWRGGKKSEGM